MDGVMGQSLTDETVYDVPSAGAGCFSLMAAASYDEYIANAKNKADKLIDISNDIIVYDLIGVTSDERDKK